MRKQILKITKRPIVKFGILPIFAIWLSLKILPAPQLFDANYSIIIEDQAGQLMGAHIAADQQWRFPLNHQIDPKYFTAVLLFEDKRFFYHYGIDPLAIARAIRLNLAQNRIVSGASTLSMQTIRLSRKGKPRTFTEKFIEMLLTLRLEAAFSKTEILHIYAAHAPFGGNVVGMEAASWRWLGRPPTELTWAEAALFAVLPNSPALIHPGRNRSKLLLKRNKLLLKLFTEGTLSESSYQNAIDEPLPVKPRPFPQIAPHLLARITTERSPNDTRFRYRTTVKMGFQQQLNNLLKKHQRRLANNHIHNVGVVVANVNTGAVLAYAGNLPDAQLRYQNSVDVITANRSTGSVLKPILYAAGLTDGYWLPSSLVPDIPTRMGGFAPQNYNLGYDGAVPAHRALARSLNIPAVRMLANFGLHRFYQTLKTCGITSLSQPATHYGLSLILGGSESSLWELTGVYANMARALTNYTEHENYDSYLQFQPLHFILGEEPKRKYATVFSASSVWFTLTALLDVERPGNHNSWQRFSSDEKVAWKTGTSFGFRDGWAIGVTPDYVVGVWAGNANGEGRPMLTGLQAAAPILFNTCDILPNSTHWFAEPKRDMQTAVVCKQSGFLASPHCPDPDTVRLPQSAERSPVCPYHKLVHLDASGNFRVSEKCISPSEMLHRAYFVLPPALEGYYKSKNAQYKELPPYAPGCKPDHAEIDEMEIIYPFSFTQIYIPRMLDGQKSDVVFEAAHRKPNSTIFWYIDEQYLGKTENMHKITTHPSYGTHTLLLTDEQGNVLKRKFTILGENSD